jgi:hypothetical protein
VHLARAPTARHDALIRVPARSTLHPPADPSGGRRSSRWSSDRLFIALFPATS